MSWKEWDVEIGDTTYEVEIDHKPKDRADLEHQAVESLTDGEIDFNSFKYKWKGREYTFKQKKYRRKIKRGYAITHEGETYWNKSEEAIEALKEQEGWRGKITLKPFSKEFNEVEYEGGEEEEWSILDDPYYQEMMFGYKFTYKGDTYYSQDKELLKAYMEESDIERDITKAEWEPDYIEVEEEDDEDFKTPEEWAKYNKRWDAYVKESDTGMVASAIIEGMSGKKLKRWKKIHENADMREVDRRVKEAEQKREQEFKGYLKRKPHKKGAMNFYHTKNPRIKEAIWDNFYVEGIEKREDITPEMIKKEIAIQKEFGHTRKSIRQLNALMKVATKGKPYKRAPKKRYRKKKPIV